MRQRHQWLPWLARIFIFFFFKNLIFYNYTVGLLTHSQQRRHHVSRPEERTLNPKTLYWVGFRYALSLFDPWQRFLAS